ncbi:Beta-enolase, partial [Stylosanthes scabra]|nr:Beta-enolase [Stylosanthes scabra]
DLSIISFREALYLVKEAVRRAGYTDKIKIAFDVAATNFCIGTRYDLDFKSLQKSGQNFLSAENMVELYRELCN